MTPATPVIQRLPVNTVGRDFFIGDLHGCRAHLEVGLAAVRFRPEVDRLISVGDLIDRGPDSLGVIRWLGRAPWFYAVLGNHEATALEAEDQVGPPGSAARLWIQIGGSWASLVSKRDAAMLMGVLRMLPLAIEVPLRDGRRVGVIHAQLPNTAGWVGLEAYAGQTLQELDASEDFDWKSCRTALLWARGQARLQEHVMKEDYWRWGDSRTSLLKKLRRTPGIDLLISGHTIRPTGHPGVFENRVCLDTGAYLRDGALTLLEPLTGRYHQVRWRKDLKGPLRKVTHHRLSEPYRAWNLRRLIRQQEATEIRDPYDF